MAIIFHKHEAYNQRYKNVEERFWEKVDKTKSCWLWRSALDKDGYGIFRLNRRDWKAHRFAFLLHYSRDPNKYLVCHHCDNPSCVNPHHLFLGTHQDNRTDCVEKNRQAFGDRNGMRLHPESRRRGKQINTCKLTPEQVLQIRKLCRPNTPIGYSFFAKLFGMNPGTISSLYNRETWKHI
jgi:hypothetical protein